MSLKESQKNIIEMLAKHEEVIGSLYKGYADRFPEYQGFFSHIAKEESEHAEWIRRLHQEIEKGNLSFSEGRFGIGRLHKSLDYVQGELGRLGEGSVSLKDALSTALKIENGMIEQEFFAFAEGDTDTFKRILEYLSKGTKEHSTRLKEVYSHNI